MPSIAPGAWIANAKCQLDLSFPVSRKDICRLAAIQVVRIEVSLLLELEHTTALNGRGGKYECLEEKEQAKNDGEGFHNGTISVYDFSNERSRTEVVDRRLT